MCDSAQKQRLFLLTIFSLMATAWQKQLCRAISMVVLLLCAHSPSDGAPPAKPDPTIAANKAPTPARRRAKPPQFDEATLKLFSTVPGWMSRPIIPWSSSVAGGAVKSATLPLKNNESSANADSQWPISAEQIEDEIKDVGDRLLKAKSDGKLARDALAELARWFDVVGQYPGEIRWKSLAKSAAAQFSKLANSAEPGGKSATEAAERGASLLNELIRSGGADLDSSAIAAGNSWTDLGPIMRRMELSHREKVSPQLANDKDFSAASESLMHEGAVVAALAKIIPSDSYGFGEDAGFASYAQMLANAQIQLRDAAERGDRAAAQAAWDAAEKSCNDCHGDYR